MPKIFDCEQCKTTFTIKRNREKRRFCSLTCSRKYEIKKAQPCKNCGNPTKNEFFCSKSCSASFTNVGKIKTENTKNKISKKLKGKPIAENTKNKISFTMRARSATNKVDRKNKIVKDKPIKVKKIIKEKINVSEKVGPFSKVYRNVCKKTGLVFYSKTYRKYHPKVYNDRQHYRYLCKFTFPISHFSDWFDINLIKEYGWYSTPGSRRGKRNLNGVSRDHKISIDYGFTHNIDPEIISHPANCSLVLHTQNQVKNTKCSITLEDLLANIKTFEIIYPNWKS